MYSKKYSTVLARDAEMDVTTCCPLFDICYLVHCHIVSPHSMVFCSASFHRKIIDTLNRSRFGPFLAFKLIWLINLMLCMPSWSSHWGMIEFFLEHCAFSNVQTWSRTRLAQILNFKLLQFFNFILDWSFGCIFS